MKIITLYKYKNWNEICHMCVSSEPTTVAKNNVRHLKAEEIYIIFYAIVIMQSEKYPVLLIRSNHNIILEISLYLLKE